MNSSILKYYKSNKTRLGIAPISWQLCLLALKKKTFSILVFAGIMLSVFHVSATETTIYATRYKLRKFNYVDDAAELLVPSSTTAQPVGMNIRYTDSYDSEILCVFDLSVIPAGATINNVDFGYNVSALSAGTDLVEIFVCNRDWTPPVQYEDLGGLGDGAWSISLANQTCSATGWNGWNDNATLRSLVEDSLATSEEVQIVLTNNPAHFSYEISVTRARLVIDWTSANTPPVAGSGNALQFDGSNDYVDCGSKAGLNITDVITIEAWVNPASSGASPYI